MSKDSGVDYVGHSSGAVFFDYNRDGLLDLFLTNVGTYTTDEKGCGGYYVGYENAFLGHQFPERIEYSRLYKKLGNYRFVDVTEEVRLLDAQRAQPHRSGDASFVDLRGDGYPDLYVLNMQGANHFPTGTTTAGSTSLSPTESRQREVRGRSRTGSVRRTTGRGGSRSAT